MAGLYSLKNPDKKIRELAEYFEVTDLLDKRFWDLSAGQKTRVNLIKSLLNEPAIILMDEPTASLDPDIADKTLSLIEQLNKSKGLSILYTSHNMNEVTRICRQVIFLDHGKIVAHDTPVGLTKRIGKAELRLTFDGDKKQLQVLLEGNNNKFSFPNDYSVIIQAEDNLMPQIIARLHQAGARITDMEINKPTLDDVFLNIARGGKNVV